MTATAPWPDLKRNLVAILRGVKPDEIVAIGNSLLEAGIEAIEVPLNSPDPFTSIGKLVDAMPASILVGAGTVVTPDEVDRLDAAGGRLLVSPNIDTDVMTRAGHYNMVTMPGVFTASEAFAALRLGASGLKFFPASALGASGIGAIRTVLPQGTVIGAVGGVSESDFAAFAGVGVRAFGLGSSLYKPGMSAGDVAARAQIAVAAWDAVFKEA